MFEQETEHILEIARQRTIGNAEAITVKDILAADVPSPVKTFFRADIEALLLDEFQQHRKKSRFNFRHPEVQSLQNQINSILVLNFTFERVEFLNRLNDTVHLVINYLVRPQWTLTSVLFEHEPSTSPLSLLRLLRYFGPYEYVKDLLVRYVQEKTAAEFTKEEFAFLLWRLDAEYLRRKSGDELARILFPLYEFFDYPKRSGNKSLPIKALVRYFEDKGLASVLSMLEGATVQGKEEISHRELGELLENVRRTNGAFEAVKLDVVPQPDNAVEAVASTVNPNPLPPSPAEFAQQVPRAPVAVQVPSTRVLEINDGDRKRFTRRIFRQDEAAFASAIGALEHTPSWKEASKVIDEIFIQNVIDPYSSDALRFIETLFKQFQKTR
ncbi:MAG: hypothetical protein HY033_12400 [Ignavibacteriae bacterium]|nr:hypothetical protein [Ignavibacteria bacterium]MBI3365693.1 hypothetical protein [Ignavibacteriota bacterium]